MASFKQGDDYKLSVLVSVSPAVDFSTATEIHAILFVGSEELTKYSLIDKEGYGKLEVGSSNNIVDIYIERAESKDFKAGQLSVNIQAVFENVDFPDGFETKNYDVNNTVRVLAGRALDNEIP